MTQMNQPLPPLPVKLGLSGGGVEGVHTPETNFTHSPIPYTIISPDSLKSVKVLFDLEKTQLPTTTIGCDTVSSSEDPLVVDQRACASMIPFQKHRPRPVLERFHLFSFEKSLESYKRTKSSMPDKFDLKIWI